MNPLDRECDVFCRYLTGRPAADYIREKYRAFHASPAAAELNAGRFDRTLVAVAARHPLAARFADAYGAAVRPGGALRQKLVLLVAVLESCAPADLRIDEPSARPGVRVWLALAAAVAGGVATLLAAAVVFAPWHAVVLLSRRPEPVCPS